MPPTAGSLGLGSLEGDAASEALGAGSLAVGAALTLGVEADAVTSGDWAGVEQAPSMAPARSSTTGVRRRFIGESIGKRYPLAAVVVEMRGLEPLTPSLQRRCSPS